MTLPTSHRALRQRAGSAKENKIDEIPTLFDKEHLGSRRMHQKAMWLDGRRKYNPEHTDMRSPEEEGPHRGEERT